MDTILLAVHNILRWVILFLGVAALIRAYRGYLGNLEWQVLDRKIGMYYSIALDVQLLIGLILYFFLSDITRPALGNIAQAMGNELTRFFLLEHFLYMILAVALAHVGTVTSRRELDIRLKHRKVAIWFSLSFVALMLGMPWFRPFLPGLGG